MDTGASPSGSVCGLLEDMFEALRCRKEGKLWPSDEQRQQQEIRRRLEKVFPKTEQGGAARRKLNYIDFSRYVALPKNTVLADVRSVVIAGAGRLGQSVCCQMLGATERYEVGRAGGFADEVVACLPEDIDSCDVIGRMEDIRLEEGDRLVNALETAAQRGRFWRELPEEKRAALYVRRHRGHRTRGGGGGRLHGDGTQLYPRREYGGPVLPAALRHGGIRRGAGRMLRAAARQLGQ